MAEAPQKDAEKRPLPGSPEARESGRRNLNSKSRSARRCCSPGSGPSRSSAAACSSSAATATRAAPMPMVLQRSTPAASSIATSRSASSSRVTVTGSMHRAARSRICSRPSYRDPRSSRNSKRCAARTRRCAPTARQRSTRSRLRMPICVHSSATLQRPLRPHRPYRRRLPMVPASEPAGLSSHRKERRKRRADSSA